MQGCLIATTVLILGSATFANDAHPIEIPPEVNGDIVIDMPIDLGRLRMKEILRFNYNEKAVPGITSLKQGKHEKFIMNSHYVIPVKNDSRVSLNYGAKSLFTATNTSFTYDDSKLEVETQTQGSSGNLDFNINIKFLTVLTVGDGLEDGDGDGEMNIVNLD